MSYCYSQSGYAAELTQDCTVYMSTTPAYSIYARELSAHIKNAIPVENHGEPQQMRTPASEVYGDYNNLKQWAGQLQKFNPDHPLLAVACSTSWETFTSAVVELTPRLTFEGLSSLGKRPRTDGENPCKGDELTNGDQYLYGSVYTGHTGSPNGYPPKVNARYGKQAKLFDGGRYNALAHRLTAHIKAAIPTYVKPSRLPEMRTWFHSNGDTYADLALWLYVFTEYWCSDDRLVDVALSQTIEEFEAGVSALPLLA